MNPYIQYMYSYPHKTAYRPLTGISLGDYASLLSGNGHGLYLHIPFCQAKCGYCNLFSVAGQDMDRVDRYLDAVERQCRQYQEVLAPNKSEFSELVIGGGTPLCLTEKQLDRMFTMLHHYFRFAANKELIVETAPNQTSKEKLRILKQAGTTRISIGIQSFSDKELKAFRRQHNVQAARKALELINMFNFGCVNMDFIYGNPQQNEESLMISLKEALCYEPDEIFLYPLYVRRGVGLEREGVVCNPKRVYAQYQAGSRFLREAGFRQDSMRRFVKQKQKRAFSECGFGTSLGLGCGGRSYLGKLHFCTPYAVSAKACAAQLEAFLQTADFTQITNGIILTEEELKRRYIIRHLLIYPGVDCEQYQAHFGSSVMTDFLILEKWVTQGYIAKAGQMLALTPQGLGLSDFLGPQLISSEIAELMEKWEEANG